MARMKGAKTLNLDRGTLLYIQQAQRYPLLDAATEIKCALRWRDHQDEQALQQLVNSHLRLVVKVAMKYRHYPVPVEELMSEGSVGLMQAIDRFDPDRGFRLSTYALWWIRASIMEFVVKNWSLVKMGTTTEQKKVFLKLRKTKAELQVYEDGDMSDEIVRKIATELRVPEADVVMMNRRLAGQDASLNVSPREGGQAEMQDLLIDESDRHDERYAEREEYAFRRRAVNEAMQDLDERERQIVTDRYLRDETLTLEKLSERFGISRQRVSQIEDCAVSKIKDRVARTETTTKQASLPDLQRRLPPAA
jgi:RNA polymerase sigma-32 factor